MKDMTSHMRLQWFIFWSVGIVIAVLELFPQIDFSISSYFFDYEAKVFPLADDEFWRDWLHHSLRYSLRPFQLLSVVLWLVSMIWAPLKKWRGVFSYFVVASVFAAGVVAELKVLTQRACPPQLIEFGGSATYQPLFSGVPEVINNKCWPGGHVMHAFTLIPIYFIVLRQGYYRAALWTLSGVLAFGMLLNITQIVRGQHFLSHNIWSMLISLSVAMAFDRLWYRKEFLITKMRAVEPCDAVPYLLISAKDVDQK